MALLKKGLTRTVWTLGGLVAFFFGLVGASPPAWAESEVRIAQADKLADPRPSPSRAIVHEGMHPTKPGVSEHETGEVIRMLEPPGQKVKEVIPERDPASETSGPAVMIDLDSKYAPIPVIETLPGEPFGTAIPEIETPPDDFKVEKGEKSSVMIEGVDGESHPDFEKSTPKKPATIEGVDGTAFP